MKTAMRTVRSGGFTLLELLVVIAIILILAGLMIPAFSNIAAKTRRITCMNNIRQLSIAYFTYACENQGQIPDAKPNNGSTSWVSGSSTANVLGGVLWPYVKNVSIYKCPEVLTTLPSILNFQQWTPSVNGWTGLFGSLSGMRPPAGTIIFVEEIQNGYGGAFDNVNGRGGGGFLNTWEDLVGVFHKNGDNYGFADGHVEFHAYENLANMIRIRNLILYPQPGQNRFPSAVNDPDFAWLVHHLNPIYFP